MEEEILLTDFVVSKRLFERFLFKVLQDNHLTIAKINTRLEDRANGQFSQQNKVAKS